MPVIGIVGHEAAKFTAEGRRRARSLIAELLSDGEVLLSSGHCHLGGVDIFAEEIARELGAFREELIFPPKDLSWSDGYKPRNIQIAEASDVVHNIVVDRLPASYTGMRFSVCYHCIKSSRKSSGIRSHIKSGGCWTAWYAKEALGKPAYWHVIENI